MRETPAEIQKMERMQYLTASPGDDQTEKSLSPFAAMV
jgi:hypothetical protein